MAIGPRGPSAPVGDMACCLWLDESRKKAAPLLARGAAGLRAVPGSVRLPSATRPAPRPSHGGPTTATHVEVVREEGHGAVLGSDGTAAGEAAGGRPTMVPGARRVGQRPRTPPAPDRRAGSGGTPAHAVRARTHARQYPKPATRTARYAQPAPPRHALFPHDAREELVREHPCPRLVDRLPASGARVPTQRRHPAAVPVQPVVEDRPEPEVERGDQRPEDP